MRGGQARAAGSSWTRMCYLVALIVAIAFGLLAGPAVRKETVCWYLPRPA